MMGRAGGSSIRVPLALGLLGLCLAAWPSIAAAEGMSEHASHDHKSLDDTEWKWPSWDETVRIVTMRDYNTRIPMLGMLLLGVCGGCVGTFMLLRKRSLISDVVSHASLSGIAAAFLIHKVLGSQDQRSLPVLLTGALVAGLAAILCTTAIRRWSRIKEDAAQAIVLSVFFGIGIALFTIVDDIPSGAVAGLNQFIFGQAASMSQDDLWLITVSVAAVLATCALLFKEFGLLCFDEDFAGTQGWPVATLDLVLMGLVVAVSVIGLQCVGLLLVVAMLIIPAAAARFWTDRLGPMALIASLLGGAGAVAGIIVSALFLRISAGAIIVLVSAGFFLFSMAFGTSRGVIRRAMVRFQTRRRVGRHDLLRSIYECLEPLLEPLPEPDNASGTAPDPLTGLLLTLDKLQPMRSWSEKRLLSLLRSASRDALLVPAGGGFQLTKPGALEARRVARNHRLWETYLITHADIAPSHVDRDADLIEHVLEPQLIEELTASLAERYPLMEMPPSPHPIFPAGNTAG